MLFMLSSILPLAILLTPSEHLNGASARHTDCFLLIGTGSLRDSDIEIKPAWASLYQM